VRARRGRETRGRHGAATAAAGAQEGEEGVGETAGGSGGGGGRGNGEYSATQVMTRLRRRVAMKRRRKEKLAAGIADLSLETLAAFVRSPNVHLQRSAIQLVVDRAMTEEFIEMLRTRCLLEDPGDNLVVVQVITLLGKFEYNKGMMIRHGIRQSLESLVVRAPSDVVVKMALSNLYDLLSGEDGARCDIASSGLITKIIEILGAEAVRNHDVTYWSLVLIHHFATSGSCLPLFSLSPPLCHNHCIISSLSPW